uniref:Putative tail protein n=1 Tax=viral metagenome TaxID=1070528 RepID=A0A6M3XLZ7_9ZZZZ
MQVGEAWVDISTRDNQLVKGLADAQSKVEKAMNAISAKMANVGKVMTIAGAAITAAFGLTVKAAMDFNKEVANIATLIPGSTKRVDELKSAIRDMAVTVGKDTTDLAQGAYQVISAWGDTADTVGILEIAAKAATAGVATTTDAIDLLSAVTKGYGDTSKEAVQKVSDMAFQTVTLGQTTFPELAGSIGKVTPLAAELGLGMDELFAVMATGTGVTGKAAEVSTQLRGIMQSLMSPTADMTKLLEEKGYASGKAMLADLGLAGALETIKNAADATNTPLQKYISSIEGQTLALALTGTQADNYITKLAAMRDSTGLTDIAFREQTEGVNAAGFAFQQAKIQIGVLAQEIGDKLLPMLVPLIQKFTEVVGKVRDWAEENKPLAETIVKFTAVAGVIMVVLGPILMMLPALITAFSGLGVVITAITSPIGLVIIAAGALYLAFTNWDKLVEIVGNIASAVTNKISEWAGAINKWWDNIVANTDNKWILVADKIMDAIKGAIRWFASTIGEWIKDIANWWGDIETDTDSIWNKIANVIMDSAKAWINFFADTLPGWILDIIHWWEKIRENTKTIWEAIKTVIVTIAQNIWNSVTSILEPIVKFVSGLWNSIKGDTSTIWGSISSIISSAVGGIKIVIGGMISTIESAWATAQKIYNWIKDKLEDAQDILDEGVTIGPTTSPGWGPGGTSVPTPEPVTPLPVYGYHQFGTPYIPKTGLYGLHKGEAVIPASQNTYDQRKSWASKIQIMPGAIVINTPKFGEGDAQEIFRLIERQARNRGLAFGRA